MRVLRGRGLEPPLNAVTSTEPCQELVASGCTSEGVSILFPLPSNELPVWTGTGASRGVLHQISSTDLKPSILLAPYNHLGLKAIQLLGPTRILPLWSRVTHHLFIYF